MLRVLRYIGRTEEGDVWSYSTQAPPPPPIETDWGDEDEEGALRIKNPKPSFLEGHSICKCDWLLMPAQQQWLIYARYPCK